MGDRLRCESGEWKTRDQFSQNQLIKYDKQARSGRATASKTGIRCMEHTSKPVVELQCEGPCDRMRELRFFSKSTRRNGKNWCVDCTDWQTKMEHDQSLPAPGGQWSVDEDYRGTLPHPTYLRDDLLPENIAGNIDDDESSFAADDATTTITSDLTSSPSLSGEPPTTSDNDPDKSPVPVLDYLPERAPHWLLPEFRGGPTGGLVSLTTSANETSATGDAEDEPARRAQDRQAVSFNAWGPGGEYARMVKTPTVASGSTRTETTGRQPANRERSAWPKAPTRKQPRQLPDYLKRDIQ
ncbi:hypothetical protein C8A00DRAFT_13833 [Chaetomidium leptoderma]|uniref:Stc1 domain-containing protein n=1 Tax=Chaetomidium leptoderma TaxID=669021 RepID=A0AAN6ZYR5_9PEZI|nr:hypothetical protein C8A00DRAFT_13833 [Chaetomidium leptoderma]